MPRAKYQLIVGYVGPSDLDEPRNAASHPWRRTSRHGVVTVERAPGVSRDVASRPTTPEEREAVRQAILAAWAADEGSAAEIGLLVGRSRNAVLGVVHRDRLARGVPATPRPPKAVSTHRDRDRRIVSLLRTAAPSDVAEAYGLSADAVRSVRTRARAAGVALPAAVGPVRRAVALPVCVEVERVSLLDVAQGQCRDLADDGLCCCRPVDEATSWCAGHRALYTRRSARRAA